MIKKYLTSIMAAISLLFICLECSNDKSTTVFIAAPGNLEVYTTSPTSANLEWTDNSDNEQEFLIYREADSVWNQIATVSENSTSYSDSTLRDSVTYSYYIIARKGSSQSATSDTATITTNAIGLPPAIPWGHTPIDSITPIPMDNPIELTWQCSDPDGDSLYYYVWIIDGAHPHDVQDTIVPTPSYFPPNLRYGAYYSWRVFAMDGHGHSVAGPTWIFSTTSIRQIAYLPQNDTYTAFSESDNYLYVASLSRILTIYDISDPTSPVVSGTFNVGAPVNNITISGDYAYLACESWGLIILNISDHHQPVQISLWNPSLLVSTIYINGNVCFMGSGYNFCTVDISDKTNLILIDSCSIPGITKDVRIHDNYAVIAHSTGVSLVDISNPQNLTTVSTCVVAATTNKIDVAGNYAYLATASNGMIIVDITDVNHPAISTSYATSYEYNVLIHENFALIGEGNFGLFILDITEHSHLRMMPFFTVRGQPRHICMEGDYIYIASYFGGLYILRFML
jgi:hypothetical protein